MKKFCVHVYRLLFLLLCNATLVANADLAKGHTYVSVRSPGSKNIALAGWQELIFNKNKKIIGSNLSVSGFYGASNNGTELGAMLAYGRNWFKLNETSGGDGDNGQNWVDNGAAANNSISADNVSIYPKQTRYGAQFNFLQKLDVLYEGLYIGVNATAAQVVNNTNLTVVNQSAAVKGLTLTDYVGGKLSSTSNQLALNYSRLNNLDQKKTGICDAEFLVGLTALNTDNAQMGIHAAVVFPTDTASNCINLFEPRVGNQHWGFGAGTNLCINMFKTNNIMVNFVANGEYRYLFQAIEKRTFDCLNRFTKIGADFSRYVLITDATAEADQKLRPAANDLTQDFWLTPGSKFEGTILFGINAYGASINAGYNLFFKNPETGYLKNVWVDNTIGFGRPSFLISAVPNLNGVTNSTQADDQTIDPINNAILDYNSVFSASQLTHKLFLSMGYAAINLRCPFMINCGAAYEFADHKSTALEGFEVWGKVGFSF